MYFYTNEKPPIRDRSDGGFFCSVPLTAMKELQGQIGHGQKSTLKFYLDLLRFQLLGFLLVRLPERPLMLDPRNCTSCS